METTFSGIHDALQKIHPLTDEAREDLSALFETTRLSRNEYLLKEGDRVYNCYFQLEGVIRVFYNNEGNEYNKTFFIPGMFPTPLTALLTGGPSQLSFQALRDCLLVRFSYKSFRALFSQHRCLESLMLAILEQEWIHKERHDIRMVTNDATTNYLIFREQYPNLENLILQYHIASYLGITPIQLSRIRSQQSKPAAKVN
ncbi:MAG: Crp/Fnr family transcriptional regulator [Bacteroidales bacterium]|nr:Crp/Fnr family transcriptional regulator [Bacteroidales bacterium]